jgi:hypothetical protein
MSNKRIYLKKFMGLDMMIWKTGFVCIILSLLLLSYKLAKRETCKPVSFYAKSGVINTGNIFYLGESISFKSSVGGNKIEWNFDDDTPLAAGEYVTHRFAKEGRYYVKVSSGSNCEFAQIVSIVKPKAQTELEDLETTGEKIYGKNATYTGMEEIYQSLVKGDIYEWVVLNQPAMKKDGPVASFSFPGKGTYTLQLTVNNDRTKRYTKEIIVQELEKPSSKPGDVKQLIKPSEIDPIILPAKPEKPEQVTVTPPVIEPPSAPKKIKIGEPAFASYLQQVIDGQMLEADFYRYLAEEGATKVRYNNDKTTRNFSWLCNELNGKKKGFIIKKKVKIESVILKKDEADRITLIVVKTN